MTRFCLFDPAGIKGSGFATIQWGNKSITGLGRSKKIAEQRAAQNLWEA